MSSRPRSDHFDGLGLRLNHFFEFLKLVSSSICLQRWLIKDLNDSYFLFSVLSSDINALSISLISESLIVLFVVFLEHILNGFGKQTYISEDSLFVSVFFWTFYFSFVAELSSYVCSVLNSATYVLLLVPNLPTFWLESFAVLCQALVLGSADDLASLYLLRLLFNSNLDFLICSSSSKFNYFLIFSTLLIFFWIFSIYSSKSFPLLNLHDLFDLSFLVKDLSRFLLAGVVYNLLFPPKLVNVGDYSWSF